MNERIFYYPEVISVRASSSVTGTVTVLEHTDLFMIIISGVPRNFFSGGGGVQQIRSRTEKRENGDLGA